MPLLFEVVSQCFDVRFVAVCTVSRWLLRLLRCTLCCRCFGFQVVPQCYGERFTAVALVSKWCINSKIYVANACVAKMYVFFPFLWLQSGTPSLRWTIPLLCGLWCPTDNAFARLGWAGLGWAGLGWAGAAICYGQMGQI